MDIPLQLVGPGDPEQEDQPGNHEPNQPAAENPRWERQVRVAKQRLRWLLNHHFIEISISVVALVFGILSLYASWNALDIARAASRQDYWAYEAQKIGNRLSLMQLCGMNLTKYIDTCAKVETWEYLPAVYDVLYPGGGGVPEGQPPVHLVFKAGEAASTLGATAGLILSIPIVMMVWPS